MATTIDQLALMTATVVDGDLLVLRDVSVTGNNKDVKLTIGKLKLDVINAVTLTGDQTVGGNKTLTGTTIFNGNVGIGTNIPAGKFHVFDTDGGTLVVIKSNVSGVNQEVLPTGAVKKAALIRYITSQGYHGSHALIPSSIFYAGDLAVQCDSGGRVTVYSPSTIIGVVMLDLCYL